MAPKIVDKAARRAAITQAASEVFAQKGFQGTSVDDIARAAGVSKGSLYGYFKNKEDIFYATFQAYQAELMGQCEAAMAAQETMGGRLNACLMVTVLSLQEHIVLFPLTLELWAAASSGPARGSFGQIMEGMYREFRAMTAGLIQAGQANGEFREDADADAAAAWLVGGIDGLMLQYWFDRSLDVKRLTEHFLAMVLRGIGTEGGAK
ncbi:TetR/AcrR family transcriptional regulator [Gallaecimonas kandeliae]|uniref:TetR/AcrR family transcriptional regulator n=1 Tax=Gallaecimonas kandeliae TaxID=3029055 RepID=UPI0026499315|nr:TetR/AcrR family transcriptional regulator [Gallaecimonas kandeliae]WKE65247.1 TetR/AcrR family transcriptional regulator [Gallaecimonas kandeliae]